MFAHGATRRRVTTISIDKEASQAVCDALAATYRGEPKDGFVPTLDERVHAAIDLAPYYAPRILQVVPDEGPIGSYREVDVTQLSDLQLQTDSYLRLIQSLEIPNKQSRDTQAHASGIEELPHEFLVRVGRGESINGYRPPPRLRRIAAAAAAAYCAARLPGVNVQEPDRLLPKLQEEIEKRRAGLSRTPDPEEQQRAAEEVYKRLMESVSEEIAPERSAR